MVVCQQAKWYRKKDRSRVQKAGSEMVVWYDDREAGESDAVGMVEVSRVRVMSCGFKFPSGSSEATDGEGDKTMEGALVCLWAGVSFVADSMSNGFMSRSEQGKDVFVGSQSKPGLTIKLIVSPSFTSYSLRSFVSMRALPLSSRRCASAGGARGWDARCDLMSEIVSVDWTARVRVQGGFEDLNVMLMVATCHDMRRLDTRECVNGLAYLPTSTTLPCVLARVVLESARGVDTPLI